MSKGILKAAILVFPVLAAADTLIMKDGSSIRGTFNNANTRQMTFTEYNGNRRDVSLNDVQELRFGNDQQQQYSSSDRPASNDRNTGYPNPYPNAARGPVEGNPPMANPAIGDDLDRLRQDLRIAIDNNSNMPPDQRQVLEDARETLRGASQQSRNGRPVNQRNIRLALDSIRNAADRMQRQDRDRLNDDVRRISASMGGQQGRDY